MTSSQPPEARTRHPGPGVALPPDIMLKLSVKLAEAGLKTRATLKTERNALIRRIVTGKATQFDRAALETINTQLRTL